jgi:hypothetical protein
VVEQIIDYEAER